MTNGDVWCHSVTFDDIWAKYHVVYHDMSRYDPSRFREETPSNMHKFVLDLICRVMTYWADEPGYYLGVNTQHDIFRYSNRIGLFPGSLLTDNSNLSNNANRNMCSKASCSCLHWLTLLHENPYAHNDQRFTTHVSGYAVLGYGLLMSNHKHSPSFTMILITWLLWFMTFVLPIPEVWVSKWVSWQCCKHLPCFTRLKTAVTMVNSL